MAELEDWDENSVCAQIQEVGAAAGHGAVRVLHCQAHRPTSRPVQEWRCIVRFPFPAAGSGPVDSEQARLRTAVGDHGAEAGLLLLMSCGEWLPQLAEAGLIAVDICLDGCCGDGQTAQMAWGDVDEALSRGRLDGRRSEVGVLHAAASLVGARQAVLRESAAGLDRRVFGPVQAAFAFATYDAEVRRTITGARSRSPPASIHQSVLPVSAGLPGELGGLPPESRRAGGRPR